MEGCGRGSRWIAFSMCNYCMILLPHDQIDNQWTQSPPQYHLACSAHKFFDASDIFYYEISG